VGVLSIVESYTSGKVVNSDKYKLNVPFVIVSINQDFVI
jgi:hypothetical protein